MSILMLLQARGRMTAAELAHAMEVSPRTILRDIDQLSAAGVPLWGERGRQGGFQLRAGWSTQLTGMTGPEANALLLAGLPGPATELGLGTAAASARLKLLASLPGALREQAARVGERLHIDPLDWYRAGDMPQYLHEVAASVFQGQGLRVRYDSWRGVAQRDLEPLGLVLKAGAWYLVARRAGQAEPRTYRLASLRALQATGQAFTRPRGFDLARWWQASAARFEAELRQLPARLRISPRGLGWMRNARLPFELLSPGAEGQSGRIGWCVVQVPIESLEQGARQFLAWGDELEVIAPATLRAQLRRVAAGVLAVHQGEPAEDDTQRQI